MDLTITAVFYGLMGLAVATAVILNSAGSQHERWFQAIAATLFWPIFIPLLLRPSVSSQASASTAVDDSASAAAELDRLITQAEQDLAAALNSLTSTSLTRSVSEGNSLGNAVADQDRLRELQAAWQLQASRIHELDVLLTKAYSSLDHATRLREVRDRLHRDLIATLNSARDLVTTIHVARFTDHSTTRAEELLAQLTESSSLRPRSTPAMPS